MRKQPNRDLLRDFIVYWGQYMSEHPEQRNGQALYNAAHQFDGPPNDAARRATGRVDLDPYHNDDNISPFLESILNLTNEL